MDTDPWVEANELWTRDNMDVRWYIGKFNAPMDIVKARDGSGFWLVGSNDMCASIEPWVGPFATFDEAAAASLMLYETGVEL